MNEKEMRKNYERTVMNDLIVSAHVKMDVLVIQLNELEKILKKIRCIEYEMEKGK